MCIARNQPLLISHLHIQRPQHYSGQPGPSRPTGPLVLLPAEFSQSPIAATAWPFLNWLRSRGGGALLPQVRPEFLRWPCTGEEESLLSPCSEWTISRRPAPSPASLFLLNRKITVTLGAHDMKQEESTWQKLEVSEQIIHPNYNSFTKLNDIMLLKVPLTFQHVSKPPS